MTHLLKRFSILGMLVLSACLNVAEIADNPSDPASESFAASTGVVISEMTKTASGVYYKDITVGDGAQFTTQNSVDISYIAALKNGYVWDIGTDVPISLSDKVFGLRDGMVGMRVGGERLIVVPSELGFGPTIHGSVPPNSTLIFRITLTLIP